VLHGVSPGKRARMTDIPGVPREPHERPRSVWAQFGNEIRRGAIQGSVLGLVAAIIASIWAIIAGGMCK